MPMEILVRILGDDLNITEKDPTAMTHLPVSQKQDARRLHFGVADS